MANFEISVKKSEQANSVYDMNQHSYNIYMVKGQNKMLIWHLVF